MTRAAIFWMLMILTLVLGIWFHWGQGPNWHLSIPLLEFVLFGLLGWQVFGPAVRG